jgi:hypothetical protein
VDSNGQNVAIQIKGTPIIGGANESSGIVETRFWDMDTYWDYDPVQGPSDNINARPHPQNPEVWICHETYFKLSTQEGLIYVPVGTPPNTQAPE